MSDIVTKIHRDNGLLIVDRVQDVEPILEGNKARQIEGPDRKSELRHIATIPNVIIEKWLLEDGVPFMRMNGPEFAKFVRRKLDDPDWKYLRTY